MAQVLWVGIVVARRLLRAHCWADSFGIRWERAASRWRGRTEIQSPAWRFAPPHRLFFLRVPRSKVPGELENRGPRDRVVLPENARSVRRFRHSARSKNRQTDHLQFDQHRRNQMPPNPSAHKQLRDPRLRSSPSSYWRRRWHSTRLSARSHSRTRRDAEWYETTTATFRCALRRPGHRRKMPAKFRIRGRRQSSSLGRPPRGWSCKWTVTPGRDLNSRADRYDRFRRSL